MRQGYPKVEDARSINKRMDQVSQNIKQDHQAMTKRASDALGVKSHLTKRPGAGKACSPKNGFDRNKSSNNSQSVYASSISCSSDPSANYRKMSRVPSPNRIHTSGNCAEDSSTVVVAATRNGDLSVPENEKTAKTRKG